jgi:predicted site-specific integrase-resolvase
MIEIRTRELLCPRDVAFRLRVTPVRVLQLANAGRLPAIVDSGGKRTFRIEDVEQLIRERARGRKAK